MKTIRKMVGGLGKGRALLLSLAVGFGLACRAFQEKLLSNATVRSTACEALAAIVSFAIFAGFVLFALHRLGGLTETEGAALFGIGSSAFWLLATVLTLRPGAHDRWVFVCNILAACCAVAAVCYTMPRIAQLKL